MIARRKFGVVVRRELARISRRWQVYGVRVIAGLAVALVMGVVLLLNHTTNPEHFPRVGRYLFNAYAVCLLLGAGGVAPVAMAQAILEERESGTLELLTLTNVRPLDVLTGKLGTTVAMLLGFGLGTLPIGLLPITLGGVAPEQAVTLALAAIGLALASGSVAAAVALSSRNIAIPAMTTLVWVVTAPMALPVLSAKPVRRLVGGIDQFESVAIQSGIFAPFHVEWWGVLGTVPLLVTALCCLAVAALLFRQGTLSGFERLRFPKLLRYTWPLQVVLLISYWIGMATVNQMGVPRSLSSPYTPWIGVISPWLAQVSLSLLLVQGTVWLVPRLEGSITNFRLRPLPNLPIVQRELFSRAHGPLGRFLLVLVGLWLVASCGAAFAADDRDMFIGGAFIGILGTALTSTVLATSSIAGARSRGTLQLLAITTMAGWRMLAEKMTAPILRGAIPALLTLAMIVIATQGDFLGDGARPYDDAYGNAFEGVPFVRALVACAWFCSIWFALTFAQVSIALRVKNTSIVWTLNTLLGLLVPVCVFMIGVVLGESRAGTIARYCGELVFPFQRHWRQPGVPDTIIMSTAAWALLAVVLWLVALYMFKRHAHRT